MLIVKTLLLLLLLLPMLLIVLQHELAHLRQLLTEQNLGRKEALGFTQQLLDQFPQAIQSDERATNGKARGFRMRRPEDLWYAWYAIVSNGTQRLLSKKICDMPDNPLLPVIPFAA
jgi:hypothetical protein